jgi:hypothetical protein
MLMANILNLSLSKKKISDTFDISQVTIIKTFRKIYPYRKLLISNEATEKVLKLAKNSLINSEESDEMNNISVKSEDYEDSDDDDDDDEISETKKGSLISKYLN